MTNKSKPETVFKEKKKWRKCLGPGAAGCQKVIFTTKNRRICRNCAYLVEKNTSCYDALEYEVGHGG